MNALSLSQVVRKPAIASKGEIVSAQNRGVAEIGVEVLENSGDAVDAAVATSLVLGVPEPWMSGPAGGWTMIIWRAEEAKNYSYGMRSPADPDPADYPLSASGIASDLFPWRSVVGDHNVEGTTATAVPGTVDGIGIARQRFGQMPWRDSLQLAAARVHRGFQVDWYAALILSSATRSLVGTLWRKRNHVALGRRGGGEPPREARHD